MPKKSSFFRNRLLGIFDNLFASVILSVLVVVLPIVFAFILNLGTQVALLLALLFCQVLIIGLLLSIQRRVSKSTGKKEILVQSADTNIPHLLDRYGLPHPISDEDTAIYLMETLGYKQDELLKVPLETLRPLGSEVIAIRRWRRPRTIEDEMTAEARRSLKMLKKYFRTEDSLKVLSFDVRNDGEQYIQINSAKLVFDTDAPLAILDISPKNKPISAGLLTCRLLFNGESESRRLSPQEESRLDLMLKRRLTKEESDVIQSTRLGYIEITGTFRDTEIDFHLSV